MGDANRGDNAVFRPHNVADFSDVALLPRPHLADKDLIEGGHLFVDGAHNAHRCVVAALCHERVESVAQHFSQNVLDRGLAVAAGDADDRHAGGGKLLFCRFHKSVGNSFFHPFSHAPGEKRQPNGEGKPRNCGCIEKTPGCRDDKPPGACDKQQRRSRRKLTFDAVGHNKGLFLRRAY
ncbi:hypothetical protein SDC9_93589 [bioreactor metagenome]|uniref:Uncharacterized protein n=1 Tax=bioreactor metagenome TaxID=1076179 RepID=A0A645A1G7_9ZZZZ